MKQRIVIALGGNALGDTPEEQERGVKQAAGAVADMVEAGNEVLIVHGNGPQVGMITLAMETARKASGDIPVIPLSACVAMSQGYIGYDLQSALQEELAVRALRVPVATVITQTVVQEDDPAFAAPSKPIGKFYSETEAKKIEQETGCPMMEDAGRGWRRVVASPQPVDIVEKEILISMLESGQIAIAVGGGGIPVIRRGKKFSRICAVIDKDLAASVLAQDIDADMLIILTAVERVAIHYGKEDERWLDQMSPSEARSYIASGEFAPGSMLPKVQAAVSFSSSKVGRCALITSLNRALDAVEGKTGTLIAMPA